MAGDPYRILGLTHNATQYEIKKSYRKLALKFHPDRLTRTGSTQEEILAATTKFAEITSAYALLSDLARKRQYDHIYQYGGFDDTPKESQKQSSSSCNSEGRKMGIGYAVADPFTFLLSGGKNRSKAVAGISVPSRFDLARSPHAGFRVSFSKGEVRESPTGTIHCRSTTTQYGAGTKTSKTETTTVHADGRKEVVIEGDNYVERKVSTAPRKAQPSPQEEDDRDDITTAGDDQPWYIQRWNDIRENLQMCTNPELCGAISVH